MASAHRSLWDPSIDSDSYRPSTKDILRTANEINRIGDETLTQLDDQGKRIEKLQDDVARIGDKMNATDRMLHEISHFWGRFTNKFRTDNSSANATRRAEWEEEFRRKQASKPTRSVEHSSSVPQSRVSLPSLVDDPVLKEIAEEDADLEEIHLAVLQMKTKAILMGETISEHNERLDNLNHETTLQTDKIISSRNKITEIIRKI